jgi:multicomponent K+:H+ antiporter subunit D
MTAWASAGWWWQHLPVLPVLLPAFTAMALLILGDHGGSSSGHAPARLRWARRIGLASACLGLGLAVLLVGQAASGVLAVYRVGDWPAPYGIVLVVDRLGAMMLLLTSLVALPVLVYASGGWDAHGRYFHAMFQFQLMGLNGAFVTGDLFNLFVFFEVLLIASYVLMVHGQGGERFKVGLHYVVLNLLASALFLIGVSLLYARTGTLNYADLALRVPMVQGPDAMVVQAAGLVLLVVFGFKAALAPLSLWLPATYAAAAAPVAALFAIMTKVGVYAILRVQGVIFGPEAGDSALAAEPLLLPLALATSVLGVLGALAARTLERLVAWLTVASVGTILLGIGLFGSAGWAAALYYMANSTLVVAGLFLLSELVASQRGEAADKLVPAAPVAQPALLGTLMLLAAASAAGLPPLPGFIGKLLMLEASSAHAWQGALWGVILGGGFLTLVGLARAGSVLFWHVRVEPSDRGPVSSGGAGASPTLLAATLALLAATVAMSVFAAPIQRYTTQAAEQLLDRGAYARAVLGEAGLDAQTARPYRFPIPAAPGASAAPAPSTVPTAPIAPITPITPITPIVPTAPAPQDANP